MDLHSGEPYWLYNIPQLFSYGSLDHDEKTEVVIIGGGISGALSAYALTKANVPVILISKDHIGVESTAASTSLLQYEIDTPLHELIKKVGKENAERSYGLCLDALDDLEIIHKAVGANKIFKKRKSLQLASAKKDRKQLEEEFEARKSCGFKVKMLDQYDVKEQFGFHHSAALYTLQGAVTDAYQFTQKIIRWCADRGAKIYDKTELKKFHSKTRGIKIVTQDDFEISAPHAIIATGYEAAKWINKPIARLHSTYAMASEPFPTRPLWKDECMIWETASPYTYLRITDDNRVIMGGKDEMFESAVKRNKLIRKKSIQLQKAFEKLFPHLKFKIDYSWTGTFAETKDGLPFIGTYKKKSRAYFALGFGGNGIVFSQVAANLIRDIILRKQNDDLKIFSFERVNHS